MSSNGEHLGVQAESDTIMRAVSPISYLPTDIMLAIFKINADMDNDDPLVRWPTRDKNRAINTTRFSSQVSPVWRAIIINAPVLWANLIDLPFLNGTSDWWREKVILRTQDSPLYVKGPISFQGYRVYQRPWSLDFLDINWAKIRKLDLTVHLDRITSISSLKYFNAFTSLLSRSTPALESCCILLNSPLSPFQRGSLLFDNHAPQLQIFRLVNVQFSDEYSWLLQLRNLHIHRGDGRILTSVDVVYEILSRMPLLESLYFDDVISSPDISPGRVAIHLPRLTFIQFRSIVPREIGPDDREQPSRTPIWPLLNHIIPQPGCSIRLVVELLPTDEIDCSLLAGLAEKYFRLNAATYIDLGSDRNHFTLSTSKSNKSQLIYELFPETPFFDLIFNYSNDSHLPYVDQRISRLFKELLTVLSFPQVTELQLQIRTAHGDFFTDQKFSTVLSSFTSLKKLVTIPETLFHLHGSPINTPTLFPSLDSLEITVGEIPLTQVLPLEICLADSLVPFLRLRKDAGIPISMFTYGCGSDSEFGDPYFHLDDLRSLEAITGLKVVWELSDIAGTGEYICGSGKPETLDFAQYSLSE